MCRDVRRSLRTTGPEPSSRSEVKQVVFCDQSPAVGQENVGQYRLLIDTLRDALAPAAA